MSAREKHSDLIERLEKATGPDRELDVLIAAEINWQGPLVHRPIKQYISDVGGLSEAVKDIESGHPLNAFRCIPYYTTSIDAAITLVPEGFAYAVTSEGQAELRPFSCVLSRKTLSDGARRTFIAHGKTTAIALCIAALKPRSAT